MGGASDPDPPRARPPRRAQTCADMGIGEVSAKGARRPSWRVRALPAARTSSARQRGRRSKGVRPLASSVRPNARIHLVRSRGAFRARAGGRGARGELGGARAGTRRAGGGDRGGRRSRAPPGGKAARPRVAGRGRPTGSPTHRPTDRPVRRVVVAARSANRPRAPVRHNNKGGDRPS